MSSSASPVLTRTLVDGLAFAECLRWHQGRLFFSDMHAHRVLATDMAGNVEVVCEVEGRPGGLGWWPDGRLLVVSMTERNLYRLDPEGLRVAADLSPHIPWFLNDMAVGPRGHAYIGDIGFDYYGGQAFRPARLWLVTEAGDMRPVADAMYSPNGPVITPDGRVLIVAESSAARLTAFDIESSGLLANRRVWAELPGGVPDGIGLDADGNVWAAMYGGKAVWRCAEGTGVTKRVHMERDTFACAIGGSDMRTLFVATAPSHDPDDCRRMRAGRIEIVNLDRLE
jgi:sugar lactone lactonase YvrE